MFPLCYDIIKLHNTDTAYKVQTINVHDITQPTKQACLVIQPNASPAQLILPLLFIKWNSYSRDLFILQK